MTGKLTAAALAAVLAMAFAFAPRAEAYSRACLYLEPGGGGFLAEFRVYIEGDPDENNIYSGSPISAGHHQCVLLPRKSIGKRVQMRQIARGGNTTTCGPEWVMNGPGRADLVFFGKGVTAKHECNLP